jgi:hypothetical protein
MKLLKLVPALSLVTAVVACNQHSVSTSSGSGTSSSSSSSSGGEKEITMSGTSGHAELAGDKIEVKEGVVFVNGTSYGSVPPGAEVKYAMNAEGIRALFVGGERRNAAK